MPPKLKICGMRDPANISQVSALNPDYMGFIFYRGSKRYAGGMDPASLENLPASIIKTGVFVNALLSEILATVEKFNLDAVQLHGNEDVELCTRLKDVGLEVIKVFGVDEEFNFSKTKPFLGFADYFLFDTKTPIHGGSGKAFDWKLLENYREEMPYFLSGGIGLDIIKETTFLNHARLYALDLNSLFEVLPGLKDVEKLKLAIEQIKLFANEKSL